MPDRHGLLQRNNRLLAFVQRWLDAAIIGGVYVLAAYAYRGQPGGLPRLAVAVTLGASFFFIIAQNMGVYRSWRGQTLLAEFARILNAWLTTCALLLIMAWATKTTDQFSRVTLGSWFVLTPLALLSCRVTVRGLLKKLREEGRNMRAIVIAGHGASAQKLAQQIRQNPWTGYRLKGLYADSPVDTTLFGEHPVPVLGTLEQLIADTRNNEHDEVFIALPMSDEDRIAHLVAELGDSSVPVHILPDLLIFNLMHARLTNVAGLPTISVYDTPHDDLGTALKRAEDIVLSSLILSLVGLPMLLIALIIKLTSPGPVLFRQRRYGMGGQEIQVWKFRSMTVCEDGAQVVQATRGDQRITPFGAFLRRSSLDELPQFLNVLGGSMSIVGPRPHAVAHNEEYRRRIPGYMLRHLVKPGITGWAQVNGWRGETDTLEKMEKRVEFDLYYIDNWSIWFDLKIIFMTMFNGFLHKNAY